ncbi:MAG: hypothetical protein RIB45_13985 [Marivibrio sp.]|uniref:hypothetical protein n=1 Tax=Marivibrio sp. TaxID=2039719 RepID=UPI0032EB0376
MEAGLQALADEAAAAREALARGEDDIGLENVGPRIERLVKAAMQLPPEDVAALQPLMSRVRDDLQGVSDLLGEAIEAENDAANDDEASDNGADR